MYISMPEEQAGTHLPSFISITRITEKGHMVLKFARFFFRTAFRIPRIACLLIALVTPLLNRGLARAGNRQLASRSRLGDRGAGCDICTIFQRHRSNEI